MDHKFTPEWGLLNSKWGLQMHFDTNRGTVDLFKYQTTTQKICGANRNSQETQLLVLFFFQESVPINFETLDDIVINIKIQDITMISLKTKNCQFVESFSDTSLEVTTIKTTTLYSITKIYREKKNKKITQISFQSNFEDMVDIFSSNFKLIKM